MDAWTTSEIGAVPTVPFRRVLWRVAILAGMVPQEDGLTVAAAIQITEGITAANRIAERFYDWQELFQPSIETVKLHPAGAAPCVPITTAARTLSTVRDVWDKHPDVYQDACRLTCRRGRDAIFLPADFTAATCYLEYRDLPPVFDSTPYQASLAYNRAGQVVYDSDPARDGHCYRALRATQGDGLDNATAWRPLPIIERLADAVVAGASAVMATTEGQYGSSQVMEGAMAALLEHEVMLLQVQEGQVKSYQR